MKIKEEMRVGERTRWLPINKCWRCFTCMSLHTRRRRVEKEEEDNEEYDIYLPIIDGEDEVLEVRAHGFTGGNGWVREEGEDVELHRYVTLKYHSV